MDQVQWYMNLVLVFCVIWILVMIYDCKQYNGYLILILVAGDDTICFGVDCITTYCVIYLGTNCIFYYEYYGSIACSLDNNKICTFLYEQTYWNFNVFIGWYHT